MLPLATLALYLKVWSSKEMGDLLSLALARFMLCFPVSGKYCAALGDMIIIVVLSKMLHQDWVSNTQDGFLILAHRSIFSACKG